MILSNTYVWFYRGWIILFIAFLNISQVSISGQSSSKVDSLEKVIHETNGIQKARALISLSEQIKYSKPAYSLELGQQIIQIGHEQKNDTLILFGLSTRAFAFLSLYKVDSSYHLCLKGRALAEKLNNTEQLQRFYEIMTHCQRYMGSMDSALYFSKLIVDMGIIGFIPYYNLGGIYRELGNYVEALKYLNLAQDLANKSGNPTHIAAVFNVLANMYRDVGDLENAVKSGEKYLKIVETTGHSQGIMSALIFLTTNYEQPIEKRKAYIQKGLQASRELHIPDYTFQFLVEWAVTQMEEKNYQVALDTLLKLNLIQSDIKNTGQAILANNIAKCYLNLGNLNEAEKYALQAMQINKKRDRSELSLGYEILMEIYSRKKNYKAYHDLAYKYAVVKDSVERQKRLKKLAYLQAQMDDAEKQKEIAVLNSDLLREKTRRNNYILASVIAVFVLMLIIFFRTREARLQRKTAVELSGMNKQLRELDEMKGRFFANVSHELRTPLSLIKGPVSRLLSNASIGKENTRLVEMIGRNSNKLEKRINEILDLAKLDAAKMKLEEIDMELVGFSRRLVGYFESLAQQSNIKIDLITAEKNVDAFADMKKIEMILQNFISNAIKFTTEGGKIVLSFEKENDALLWAVQDSGRGIEQDQLVKIFDRFYQNPNNKTVDGGTGIGLALSRELAELMQGKVWAESEVGTGSRFYLSIPFKQGRPIYPEVDLSGEESKIQYPDISVLKSSGNILLVEDNPDLREYVSSILVNHRVLTAANGRLALELLNKQLPDLIVSDIMMPEMDGFELVEKLKKDDRFSHIPVIMLTAKAGHEDKMKALRIGVDDYLLKPFHEEELLTRIDNALSRIQGRNSDEEANEAEIIHHSQVWLEELEKIFLEHITDAHFTLDSAADMMHISKRQLQRRIKKYTGLTALDYIREIKLNQARHYLESGRFATVAEVSYSVGFEHTNYFSNLYLDRFGKKPADYLYS